jgi:hypothetical protein
MRMARYAVQTGGLQMHKELLLRKYEEKRPRGRPRIRRDDLKLMNECNELIWPSRRSRGSPLLTPQRGLLLVT